MTKEQILNYLRTTPVNTNPAVVEGMLDQMSGSDEISQYVTLLKTYVTLDEEENPLYSSVDPNELNDAVNHDKLLGLLIDPKDTNLYEQPYLCRVTSSSIDSVDFTGNMVINRQTGAVAEQPFS